MAACNNFRLEKEANNGVELDKFFNPRVIAVIEIHLQMSYITNVQHHNQYACNSLSFST